jgi:hypothetical protein
VARALPHPRPVEAARYLAVLDRRLAALAQLAALGTTTPRRLGLDRATRGLARRFLRRFEGAWDDGDENLVRGYLDRWRRPSEDPGVAAARSLLEAAAALSRIRARRGTFAFFLWEMESMLTLTGDLARIPAHSKARSARGGC